MAHRLHVGGAERDLAKLARYLDPGYFQVHTAAFHAEGERAEEIRAAGIPLLPLPVRSFRDRTAFTGARILRDYLRQHRIAVLQAFDTPTSIYCTPLGRAFGLPAVLSSHLYFRHLISGYQYHALRMVDVLSHRIVVNANAISAHLQHDYRVPAAKIFVSHNGVETAEFFPQTVPRTVWPAVGDQSPTVIGALCVQREEKRLEVLIRAFALLRKADTAASRQARLLIVGDGPMHEAWRAEVATHGLDPVCRFVRSSKDVPHWLRQMDIYVLPSRSEGFPNAVLEAMACGVVPLASRVGGIPEMVEDGESGLLFPSGNVEELAAALAHLLEHKDERIRLSCNAARRAREVFSMEAAARRMGDFYRSLLLDPPA